MPGMAALHAGAQMGGFTLADEAETFLLFRVGTYRFGIRVEAVERVVHAAEISAVPGAPRVVAGAVNVQGDALAVLDLRLRRAREAPDVRLDAKLIIVRAPARRLAILADEVTEIAQIPARALASRESLVPGADLLVDLAAVPDGLIIIQDAANLLTPGEDSRLAAALRRIAR